MHDDTKAAGRDNSAPADELKMWLAVRTDLAISAPKLAGQSGHAYGNLFADLTVLAPDSLVAYVGARTPGSDVDRGQAKIVVVVKNEAALMRVREEARLAGIHAVLVRDEGRSELPPGTPTVVAFGPAQRDSLPPYLKKLRMMTADD